MTTITAKGDTLFGRFEVTVSGEANVGEIKCSDEPFRRYIADGIRRGEGYMANAYYPDPNTMLQAYALLCNEFGYRNVRVDGELEVLEHEDGVIY